MLHNITKSGKKHGYSTSVNHILNPGVCFITCNHDVNCLEPSLIDEMEPRWS